MIIVSSVAPGNYALKGRGSNSAVQIGCPTKTLALISLNLCIPNDPKINQVGVLLFPFNHRCHKAGCLLPQRGYDTKPRVGRAFCGQPWVSDPFKPQP